MSQVVTTGKRRFGLKAIDDGTRSARFVASTSDPVVADDGVPEILEGPWNLSRFTENPVFLWNHDPNEPTGSAQEVEEDIEGLKARLFFGTAAAGPEIEHRWQKVRQQIVRGVSVRWEGGSVRYDIRDGVRTRVVKSPTLVELSLTPLPRDARALVEKPPSEQPLTDPTGEGEQPAPALSERSLEPHEAESCRSCSKRSKLRSEYRWEDCMADQVAEHGDEAKASKACGAARAKPQEDDGARGQRELIVAAARLLRSARTLKRRTETRADEGDSDGTVLRFDATFGRLGKAERTQIGGARLPARMSRTGVLSYRKADGTVRRELRLPEEIGKPESLATLRGAPVVVGHPYELGGELDASTYRAYTKGHVETATLHDKAHADGERWIEGSVVVQDAATLDAIDSAELGGLSLGYRSTLEFTPGVWRGQPYDAIQRNIRYNHLAVLKPSGGRAGAAAEFNLDGLEPDAGICVHEDEETMDPKTIKVIRLDGREFEIGSADHLIKLDEMHSKELTELRTKHSTDIAALTRTTETQKANLDAADLKVKKLETELAEVKDVKHLDALVNARVSLLTNATRILGDEVKLDGKTEREIWLECIRTDEKDFPENDSRTGKAHTDDYLRARFDGVCKSSVRHDSIDSVVKRLGDETTLDSKDSPVVAAQVKAFEARQRGYRPESSDAK